ncbi:LLM class flavin-dependent oxidoreductase [Natronomonas marina]|uniref:LLM class flavin-dependent oxidoreductase n=1 Tax=Natronomonas marina TaxID=2961939 RepID=UPI0020C97FA7|nr:LLM class flavin-dependent oxidoreductase [Natronomonas marina]
MVDESDTGDGEERLGVSIALDDDMNLVQRVEELGYHSVWAAEGQGKTAFGKLERWATVTDRIRLATGIVNVFSRSPAAIAQGIATLDEHSDGRAILGLGVAHPGVVEEFHGMEFDRPLPRMVEYITLIRKYLAGSGEEFDGEFYSPGRASFWESFEPTRGEIPIYNAALGPGNVRLTGEYADGWLPNLYPREKLDEAQSWLAEGAERAGRDIGDIDVAMYVLGAVSEDPAHARQVAAKHVARYFRSIPGYYDRVAVESGFEDDVEAARNASSLDAAATAISEEYLDIVAVVGTPREAADKLQTLRDAGVNMPIIRPAGGDPALVEETYEALAPE